MSHVAVWKKYKTPKPQNPKTPLSSKEEECK
jgi:hypothetical protein